ncbi:Oidioi.mRNA.OKI2018_I69.PAR.g8711.t1.cds [Oikopleura dioica]|uniref:Oidioi.mRNA.OKI2018_I69.PAR.g8711.t1.cds n=1 Tax=Oikopleura dioica TaxID=34765 RepID=A0ABN7RKN2_OIKDI|nr:Oidioi.mRNA.OKI2018_I69.PAR.g8711.t1.cds [Oikopleura dioica]
MALYEDKAMIIGATRSNQVETLASSGWQESVSHLREIAAHTCISVHNGVLTIGGYLYDGPQMGNTKNVYLLREGQWSHVGALIHPNNRGTSIHFGEFFLVFGGYAPNYVT